MEMYEAGKAYEDWDFAADPASEVLDRLPGLSSAQCSIVTMQLCIGFLYKWDPSLSFVHRPRKVQTLPSLTSRVVVEFLVVMVKRLFVVGEFRELGIGDKDKTRSSDKYNGDGDEIRTYSSMMTSVQCPSWKKTKPYTPTSSSRSTQIRSKRFGTVAMVARALRNQASSSQPCSTSLLDAPSLKKVGQSNRSVMRITSPGSRDSLAAGATRPLRQLSRSFSISQSTSLQVMLSSGRGRSAWKRPTHRYFRFLARQSLAMAWTLRRHCSIAVSSSAVTSRPTARLGLRGSKAVFSVFVNVPVFWVRRLRRPRLTLSGCSCCCLFFVGGIL